MAMSARKQWNMGALCVQQRAGVPETAPRRLGQNGGVAKTYGFCTGGGDESWVIALYGLFKGAPLQRVSYKKKKKHVYLDKYIATVILESWSKTRQPPAPHTRSHSCPWSSERINRIVTPESFNTWEISARKASWDSFPWHLSSPSIISIREEFERDVDKFERSNRCRQSWAAESAVSSCSCSRDLM